MNRGKDWMTSSILKAQIFQPIRGDWILQIYEDMNDFDLPVNHEFYETTSSNKFKALVKQKAEKYAFNKYLRMKKGHSKMLNLSYKSLKIQEYLKKKSLTNEERRKVLRWRIKMERFGKNFRGKKKEILCPLCHEHKDNQEQSFYNCSTIKKNVEIEGNYESIFSETIDTKSVKSICKILKTRTKYMETIE